MSGCIKEINCGVPVIELQHGGGDRYTPLLLQLHPIRGHLALLTTSFNGPGLLDRTSIKQQFFGKGGLPRIRMGNDREIAATANGLGQRGLKDLIYID